MFEIKKVNGDHVLNYGNVVLLVVFCFSFLTGFGQTVVTSAGGNASGSGGTVSYTLGQVAFNVYQGVGGSVAEGVQQPYEISEVIKIDRPEIMLNIIVYPNPTTDCLLLKIEGVQIEDFRYLFFDVNGILLLDEEIVSNKTEMQTSSLASGSYFIKVFQSNKEIKVFKIIKN